MISSDDRALRIKSRWTSDFDNHVEESLRRVMPGALVSENDILFSV